MKVCGKPLKSILKGPSQAGMKRVQKSGHFLKSPSPARAEIDYDKLAKKVSARMSLQSQPKDKKQKGSSFLPKVTGSDDDESSSELEIERIYLNLGKNGFLLRGLLAPCSLPQLCST